MMPRARVRLWPALALACAACPAQATPPDRVNLHCGNPDEDDFDATLFPLIPPEG